VIGVTKMKIAAIYSRKSKITEKGDSIENQINICKAYLSNMGISEYSIYEDEGFSGKNTQRPEFQLMLKDAKNKKFDVLICYKLDRVSRNVSDFSALIEFLDKNSIGFISITEKFDTTNPMGRAMMYISSVFSQLERETIAQRVKDNMLELAKDGKWLGGMTPTGFESKKITIVDGNLKAKSYHVLSPIQSELELVKLIYNKYLETKSLSQVEKYLSMNNYRTKMNTQWTKSKLKYILNHPVYAKASKEVFDYLENKKMIVTGAPDNIHGMLLYGRRHGKSGYNKIEVWMASASRHEGIIDGANWVNVQKTMDLNMKKGARTGTTNLALLTGVMRCKLCGSKMRVHHGKILKSTGQKQFFYACTLKYDSGCTKCNNINLDGPEVEKLVISKLKDICVDKNMLIKKLNEYKKELLRSDIDNEYNNLNNQLKQVKNLINNVIKTITLTEEVEISQMLVNKLKELQDKQHSMEFELKKIDEVNKNFDTDEINIDSLIKGIDDFNSMIDICEFSERKKLLSSLIEKIYWNGETKDLDIVLCNELGL